MTVLRIGQLADQTGLSVRTLHHYDHIGLVTPSSRTAGGHRLYSPADVARLYRVVVLRHLGMSTAQIVTELACPGADLAGIARRQRSALDADLAALGTLRQRLDVLLDDERGEASGTTDLIRATLRSAARPFAVRHALALLPYDDVAQAQDRLVAMFGFEASGLDLDASGRAVHAVVLAGAGYVHLHEPTADLAPPGPDGRATAAVVAAVDDVDEHCAHAVAQGGVLTYGPADMPYGVREYGVRDHAGHPWSFQSPLDRTVRPDPIPRSAP